MATSAGAAGAATAVVAEMVAPLAAGTLALETDEFAAAAGRAPQTPATKRPPPQAAQHCSQAGQCRALAAAGRRAPRTPATLRPPAQAE